MLFQFRSVITDLHNQIARLNKIQYANESERFTVYRGQGMSEEEVQNIIENRGGLLSFNTFLSTTLSSNIASDYAGEACSRLIHERSVLFQIDIDSTIGFVQPFANISEYSCMKDENEILFSLGAVFRINDISELTVGGLWIVELTLTDAYDPNLDRLYAYYRRGLDETPTYVILVDMLRRGSHQLDRAEQYCSQLFNNPSADRGLIYYQAGLLYEEEVRDLAKLHYRGAVRCFTESHNHNGLVQVWATQADFYRKQHKLKKALACNRKARISEKCIIEGTRLQSLPDLDTNLADIYSTMGKHCSALKYFKKTAQTNQKRRLPINHPTYSNTYLSIGDEYAKMQQWKRALKCYKKAFAIKELYLKKEDIDLGQLLIKIAKIQVRLSNSLEAISVYQHAISILSNSNQRDEEELVDTHRRLGRIYEQNKQFNEALDHYRIALALPARNATSVHMDIAHACEHSGDSQSSMKACRRGLQEFRRLGKKVLLSDSEVDAILFLKDTLGRLYQEQNNFRLALFHFRDKLHIELVWFPKDQDRLFVSYYRLASCHFKARQHNTAKKYYKQLLQCAPTTDGNSKNMLRSFFQFFMEQNYYTEALEVLHKQLSLTDEPWQQAQIYTSMAFVYRKMGRCQTSQKLYEYALPILTMMSDSDGIIDVSSIEHTFRPISNRPKEKSESGPKDLVSVKEMTNGVQQFTLTDNVE